MAEHEGQRHAAGGQDQVVFVAEIVDADHQRPVPQVHRVRAFADPAQRRPVGEDGVLFGGEQHHRRAEHRHQRAPLRPHQMSERQDRIGDQGQAADLQSVAQGRRAWRLGGRQRHQAAGDLLPRAERQQEEGGGRFGRCHVQAQAERQRPAGGRQAIPWVASGGTVDSSLVEKVDAQYSSLLSKDETTMRTLFRLLRGHGTPNSAVVSAFVLCGLYFVSWYLITHWSDFPGAPIFYR